MLGKKVLAELKFHYLGTWKTSKGTFEVGLDEKRDQYYLSLDTRSLLITIDPDSIIQNFSDNIDEITLHETPFTASRISAGIYKSSGMRAIVSCSPKDNMFINRILIGGGTKIQPLLDFYKRILQGIESPAETLEPESKEE